MFLSEKGRSRKLKYLVAPVLPVAQLKVGRHDAHEAKLLLEVVLAHGTAEKEE